MTEPIINNRWDKRARTAVEPRGKSRTKQSEAKETDINTIVKRHQRTGVVTHLARRAPQYGDFSQSVLLQEALNLVHESDDAFAALPSEVRKAAGNDPVRLLEMLADLEETEQLVGAGLDAEIRRTDDDPLQDLEPVTAVNKEEGANAPAIKGDD